jgi:hypothetical protein
MYCECPVRHYERLKRNGYEHQNYEVVEQIKEEDILEEMKRDYEEGSLTNIGPWKNMGELPITYANPKEKNVEDKERIISSYYNVPLKTVFKRTQKVLTWLFRNLPKRIKHFTLHKLGDIKDRVRQAKEEIRGKLGENMKIIPFSSDVTAMYTHL